MTSCTDFEPLIAERASGPISPADAARLDAHLAGCAHCRAELAAYEQALGLARLPEPSEAERQTLAHLPARVRTELRSAPFANVLRRFMVLGFAAAAVVVIVANRVVIPASRRSAGPSAAERAWQVPDPAALVERIEKEHPELAVAPENELVRAEQLADVAYQRVVANGE